MTITETAQAVLEARYYLPGETEWGHLTHRVASQFSNSTEEYEIFKGLMDRLDFLPNSPALMNAGTSLTNYSACFVLPIDDSIESIYKFYGDAALISKSGGGVGASWSRLRAKDQEVGSTKGVSSGPLSFMKIQDTSTGEIKQGGRRRGANMAVLHDHHPDFEEFIHAKEVDGVLSNFNLSVGLSDHFMDDAISWPPEVGEALAVEKRRQQWDTIVQKAWEGAEPGVLFMDTINRGNLTPHLGEIESTNPCGEQPLLPYESCTLGSINLSNMVCEIVTQTAATVDTYHNEVDWDYLKATVHSAVLFLNRILDYSKFPIPECQEAMEKTRKIGLGIMGLHDMLIQLGIAYDSEEGRKVAEEVMEFIAKESDEMSFELGESEGFYDAFEMGDQGLRGMPKLSPKGPMRRNANLTTIAPTGTLSMIADCSSGCEPYYAMKVQKNVLDGESFEMLNKWYDPDKPEELFKGAMEIDPKDHVLMQACLQRHVDSSISKTINMPKEATVEDVKEVLELAYTSGCKGVTVYRDGSREGQILTTTASDPVDTPPQELIKWDLPDELSAKRYRIFDREGRKAYIIVCHEDGVPLEIFHKQPFKENDTLWSTVCRQVSLSLRYGIPVQDVIKQLDKASFSMTDLPAQLSKILKTYLSDGGEWKTGNRCTECSQGIMIYQSGCEHCDCCGHSKCG
jgi:ribonucleoside-diphosphate reductase alpha chain